ncbi:MAG: hypothetical protein KAS23_07520 [Anaerohalosphaera sp.]|nr:hypothetical protein [Anaerohalosphaera sp.]
MGLEYLDLICIVEKTLEIKIAKEETANLTTVGQFHEYLLSKIGNEQISTTNRLQMGRTNSDNVWNFIVKTISNRYLIPAEDIHPNSRFIEDLNFG